MTLNAKIGVFTDSFEISGCEAHFNSELHQNQLRYTWTSCIWNFQHWTWILTVQVSLF